MRYPPKQHSVAVVLVGSFNPAIVSPARLVMNGLVGDDLLDAAEVQIIHQDIAEFDIGDYNIHVEQGRFQVNSTKEPFIRVSDLIVGLFQTVLPHTPIKQFGINYTLHFALDSADQKHRLGRRLAPTEPWGEFGKELEPAKKSERGGLRQLVMEQVRPNGREGYRRVHIEPSNRADIVDPNVGVYMMVNDHWEVPDPPKNRETAAAAMKLLADNFDESVARSKNIVSQLMELASTI